MALLVITGLANCGKTGRVYSRVREASSAGRNPVLLLPSEPEVQRAAGELCQSGPLGTSVLQFDRYLDSLWLSLGDGRLIVGQTQRTLLLRQALKTHPPAILKGSAEHAGFLRILERVVQRAGERVPVDGALARTEAHRSAAGEILRLVDAYEALLLQSGLVESSAAHRCVVERIESHSMSGPLAVNRFGSFTPIQRAFLTRAVELGVEVTVALTWADGHPATTAADETIRYLMGLPGAEIVQLDSPQPPSMEIQALEQSLFTGVSPRTPLKAGGAVVLSEAAGVSGEAQRIIREIQELEISGIPLEEIAVVFRRPEAHIEAIAAALAEAGLSFNLDARVPVVRTGLGRALSLLLQHLCGGRERAELVGFLRSGYAWTAPGDVDHFDERARRARPPGGFRLLADAKLIGPKTHVFLDRAETLCGVSLDASHVSGWRYLIADMLRSRHGAPSVFGPEGLADAGAQRAIMQAIEEMTALTCCQFTPRDVLDQLGALDVSLSGGEREGQLHVMNAERARSRRFDAIVVGGLVGGEFPVNAAEDALGRPDLTAALARAGIDVASRGGAAEERMLFYQVVTGARKKVVLSRAVVDDDGKPLRASTFWEDVLDLYRDPETGDFASDEGPRTRRLTLADLAEHEDAPLSERRALRDQASAASAGATLGALTPRVALARWRAGARSGCVTGEVAESLARREVFSASDIEAYLACPYRWFYQRELTAKPLEEALDALEKGRIAHEILRTFYDAWIANGYDRVTPELLAEASSQLALSAELVVASRPAPRTLLEEEVVRGAVSGARRIVERDARFLPGFAPVHHEWSFGASGGTGAEEIGSFFLRGRIDRIEVSPGGIMIVDYKSGGTVAPRAKFASEGLVQLQLYGLIASRRLNQPLLGGLYRSMLYGGDRGFYLSEGLAGAGLSAKDGCTEEELEQVLADAVIAAETAVAGMRAGEIPATPRKTGTCEYCVARCVCGGSKQ